ncbi:MAG: hypothetical protein QOG59_2237 [Solirubrobacteraceae bacterium]|nr:hypothetical protein [Solirubrobacteraceae bacterium]
MTYLPELRESLVKAAERHAEMPSAAPVAVRSRRARRARRSVGALALMGASVAALVVAGAVLVLAGHRSPSPATAPAGPVYGDRAAARAVAADLLAAFQAPAGAVPVSTDLSRPRNLGSPNSGLPVASALDLHRFYRVPGDPQAIMNAITPQRSFPRALLGANGGGSATTGSGSSTASVGGSGGPGGSVIETASMTFPLASIGGIARELQVGVASAGHGMTALRVDAQAWWLVPRPASERIPTSVNAVAVQEIGAIPRAARKLHPLNRLVTPAQVRESISLVNSLGARQPDTRTCVGTQGMAFRLVFLGSGQHPDPVAVIHPNCRLVDLALLGRAQPELAWGPSDFPRAFQFLELLMGAPRTNPLALARAIATSGRSSSSRVQPAPHAVIVGPPPTRTLPGR